MKVFLIILCIVLIIVPILVYGGAIVNAIQFDANCTSYLKMAADANDVNIANKHLTSAIEYLEKKANSYRKAFANNVHFSIRTTICEKITSLAEIYLAEILEKTKTAEAKTIAVFFARGLCGALLRDDAAYYSDNKDSILKIAKNLAGMKTDEHAAPKKETPAAPVQRKKDIPSFLL